MLLLACAFILMKERSFWLNLGFFHRFKNVALDIFCCVRNIYFTRNWLCCRLQVVGLPTDRLVITLILLVATKEKTIFLIKLKHVVTVGARGDAVG
jgi:hypothetical protein